MKYYITNKTLDQKYEIPDMYEEVEIIDDCDDVKTLVLNENLKTVENFRGNNLENIVFNKNLEEIKSAAFASTKIKRLDFNDNLKLIDFGAFYNCKDLESITFNSSPIIDNYSFNGCTNVKKIIISDKVLSRKLQINISDDYELSSISSKIYENTLFTIEEISKDKKFKHIIKVGKKYIDNEIVELNNNLNNTKKLTKKPIK